MSEPGGKLSREEAVRLGLIPPDDGSRKERVEALVRGGDGPEREAQTVSDKILTVEELEETIRPLVLSQHDLNWVKNHTSAIQPEHKLAATALHYLAEAKAAEARAERAEAVIRDGNRLLPSGAIGVGPCSMSDDERDATVRAILAQEGGS
ncbi:MAG: hypothetical protein VW239_00240 [Candidatus Nanopelagicales bacterium]